MKRNTLENLDYRKVLVAPSILSADFARLGEEIRAVDTAGADIIHVDIMDAHFVPNLTIGPPVVKCVRPASRLPFDVHLMLTNPRQYVRAFADAGADHITFHIECGDGIDETIDEIRRHSCSVGLSLKPGTAASSILPYLSKIDLVLVMTVEPGFGGQSFMSGMMPKVTEFRKAIDKIGLPIHLEVDGGVGPDTAGIVTKAGANILVAGTSVFKNPVGCREAIKMLRNA